MIQAKSSFIVATFWWRLLASFLDTALTIAVIAIIIRSIDLQSPTFNPLNYYLALIFIVIHLIFYYFIFTYFNNGLTLFMMLLGLSCQNLQKESKIKVWQNIKRYLLGSGFFTFLIILQGALVSPSLLIAVSKGTPISTTQQIILSIPGAFSTFWVVATLINHVSPLVSKKHYSLADAFSKTVLMKKTKHFKEEEKLNTTYLENLQPRNYQVVIWRDINEWENRQ